ncbi:MAG: PAS domain S-box protein [Elusimicrobiales bacterium]|jgi:PAS domain S-box-containing protein|nr:PAS domain S-box protein [Elusimicrobiales bacterium]NLH39477.1 PAS domain S-box protein [Elusimicrobiota bacterium]
MKTYDKILRSYLLNKNPDFEKISNNILKIIKKETRSRYGFVGYMDLKTGKLVVPTFSKKVSKDCKIINRVNVFENFNNLFGWGIKNKKTVISNAVTTDPRSHGLPDGHIKIERFLASPAIIRNNVVGMLAVANKKEEYTGEDIENIENLANIYAVIVYHLIRVKERENYTNMISQVIENSRDTIYVINRNGIIEYINSRVKDYGYKKEDIEGKLTFNFTHPDDREFVEKAFKNAMETGKTLKTLSHRILKKDGSFYEADQKSEVIFENGKPAKIVGVIRDVTEERNIRRRLEESNEILKKIFDSAKDMIFIKDLSGNYINVNKTFLETLKITTDKIIGKNDRDFFTGEVINEIIKTDSEIKSGKTITHTSEVDINGNRHIFNTIKVPIKGSDGNTKYILGIARDITRLRKLERKMALMKAGENISELTGKFAHDVNNILSIISGYSSLIEEEILKNKDMLKEIKMIKKSVNKISSVTKQFRKSAITAINK